MWSASDSTVVLKSTCQIYGYHWAEKILVITICISGSCLVEKLMWLPITKKNQKDAKLMRLPITKKNRKDAKFCDIYRVRTPLILGLRSADFSIFSFQNSFLKHFEMFADITVFLFPLKLTDFSSLYAVC